MNHISSLSDQMYLESTYELTRAEGLPLAGKRAARIVDGHHPDPVGTAGLQLLQDTVALLHGHAILLRHRWGEDRIVVCINTIRTLAASVVCGWSYVSVKGYLLVGPPHSRPGSSL